MNISTEWTNEERFEIIKIILNGFMGATFIGINVDFFPLFRMQTVAFLAMEPKESLEGLRNQIEHIINEDIPKLLEFVDSVHSKPIDSNNLDRQRNEYYLLTHSIFYPFLTWVPVSQ